MEPQKIMEPEVILVVGEKGSGKSTWISEFIQNYRRNVIVLKHKVNIYDKAFANLSEKTTASFRQGAVPGAPVKCKMQCSSRKDFDDFLIWAEHDFRHGIMVFDDGKLFIRDRPSDRFLEFLIMNRHYAMHIFLVFQSLTAIPAEVFDYCQKVVLFKTTGNPKRRKDKISDYEALMYAQQKAYENSQNPATRYKPVIMRLKGGIAG